MVVATLLMSTSPSQAAPPGEALYMYHCSACHQPDGKGIPANSYDKRNKLVYLRYPISMYPNIIDILRNEKPIYFSYSLNLNMGFIRTGKEPIGEGDNDADF